MGGLRLGGHPLHPALVHFPVAGWTLAPVFGGIHVATHDPVWWEYAWWSMAGGVIVALPAMLAGFMDLMAIPAGHPAQMTAQRHMLLMSSAWCVFVTALVLLPLHAAPAVSSDWSSLGLPLLGFVLVAAGGNAGARLVYDFGIGRSGKN